MGAGLRTQPIVNTLLIPCWRRPEFLRLCLENLTQAEGIKDVHVIFRPDHGSDPENIKVIEQFKARLGSHEVIPTDRTGYTSTKQSYSLLTGYMIAGQRSTDLVFMVEEDVMVSRDFFRYHTTLHARENLFCSLSTKNHNRQVTTTDDPGAYYLTTLDYCSLGVCFKADTIYEHVIPHINESYLKSPARYVSAKFPGSILHKSMCEQDGLIRRIQENVGPQLPIAYPHVPRAFHAGYYGYNRPQKAPKTFAERLARLRSVIYNKEAMRLASLNPAMAADSEPVPLDIPAWTELRRAQPPELAV